MDFTRSQKVITSLNKIKGDAKVERIASPYGFSVKVMSKLSKALGEESEECKKMRMYFYSKPKTEPPWNTHRFIQWQLSNNYATFESIIDSGIEQIEVYGLYQPLGSKKNTFSDASNIELYSWLLGLLAAFFTSGMWFQENVVTSRAESPANSPAASPQTNQKDGLQYTGKGTPKPDPNQKSQPQKDSVR